MTSTPDTDIRAALTEAATMSDLDFDEAAVFSQGHRLVRRRRVATVGAGVAALALGTVVALQVSGNGFNRALPPATNPTSTVIAVAGPIDETGEVLPGFDEGQKPQGYGARLSVKGGAGGQVVETWTVTDAGKAVKTFTRAAKVLDVGQASLVLPAESGIPNLVLGYVNTGSDRSAVAGVNVAPEPPRGGGGGGEQLKAFSGGPQRHDHLFVNTFDAFDPSKIVGLSWGETSEANPLVPEQRSILLNTGRTDLVAAVLTEPDGNQWISWSSATQIGVAGLGGGSRPAAATGALQLLGRPAVDNPALAQHDKIFGWVTGGDGNDVKVKTAGGDYRITYGTTSSGRHPILITSVDGRFTRPVTVSGGGVTQTVDVGALRNTPQ